MDKEVKDFMKKVSKKNKNEREFIQAVYEVAETIIPFIHQHKKYQNKKLLERMVEPERVIIFRVPWLDDKGEIQVNRGYRVQMNSALGPFKGGLRFHPSVNLSILKFLGFEQVFKNSLTTLPMGGGKGGADFDPKGRSSNEVMKFCQSFMTELQRHIGANTDIPAGDIGVGGREIGYLFGQFKKIRNENTGVLTGKGLSYGGSLIRPEATGYGMVYFAQNMLRKRNDTIKGKTIAISGSGNVAQFAAEKAIALGGKVLTFSDSSGYIYDENGIDSEKLHAVMHLKNEERGRIKEYVKTYPEAKYFRRKTPWEVKCDIAFPCATENELNEKDAKNLIDNECSLVAEGANMPCTSKAIAVFKNANILFAPGKASNAGGVATSGLEMSQNSLRYNWSREEVDDKLKLIMKKIHGQCVKYGSNDSHEIDYIKGANIAGFVKVADAMLAQGVV